MVTVTEKDLLILENDLKKAFAKFSCGKLDNAQLNKLAEIAVSSIDFLNPALTHKGVNWYARHILELVDIEVNIH